MALDPVRSHLSWFGRGRERVRLEGVDVFLGSGDATIAFPGPGADLSGAVRLAVDRGVREVGCWAFAPDEELDGVLPLWASRTAGRRTGWESIPVASSSRLRAPSRRRRNAPTASRTAGWGTALSREAVSITSSCARTGGSSGTPFSTSTGEQGGIYDMGVAPHARRRGHARSLTLAALARAQEAGCTGVTLNATGEGEPVYRSAGFAVARVGHDLVALPAQVTPVDAVATGIGVVYRCHQPSSRFSNQWWA